jgi:choline dehydrogenase
VTGQHADVIVVGAGSAGSALAARLTEDGRTRVLLLEAGGADRRPEIHIPAAFSTLFQGANDWNYRTTPQPTLNDRQIYWPRGKVLGGSSSLNAMMWVRGFAADFDRWAELAGSEWSYQDLLPYFRRVERIAGSTDPEQGSGGAVTIEAQRDPRSHTAAFLDAAREIGYDVVAPISAAPLGFSQTMVTQDRGRRVSTADAYLRPARGRKNLTVVTEALVSRVLIDEGRAVGVEYLRDGVLHTASAAREVVLAGGAINTPQLLQLSGIGDRQELTRLGIPVTAHSPEVGRNLRDHLVSGLIIETAGDTLFSAQSLRQLGRYLTRRRGMLTSNVAEAYGFVRTRDDLALPDVEILFAPVAFAGEGLVPPPAHGLTLGSILLQPESHGTVTLASTDASDAPIIDPRYLSDPEGKDRRTILAGLAICERLMLSPALRARSGPRFVVPEGAENLSAEARAELSLEQFAHTLYHPVGTARMGSDAASVVDPQLRVRGVRGLRVADASVMPMIVRGHTNAATIVIGEKAADLIRAELASS